MAASIILLGPGALSLDCRLFGRREIVIPYDKHSPRRGLSYHPSSVPQPDSIIFSP
ncbi:MAG: hypothetical protein KF868_06615 [Acidobacteria bacterium]|nr:hypothetical protein [Acidobacteriota bacterium]MCW5968782.1 hypothetical protein [Blastocatellales bacterium]